MRYFRIAPEVAGGLGPRSVMDRSTHPPRVSRLHHVFDGWQGDELLESFPCFIVTAKAGALLRDRNLSGFALRDVEIDTSDTYQEVMPHRELPEFRRLDVVGIAREDDFGLDDDGVLVISETALEVLRAGQLEHADLEEA